MEVVKLNGATKGYIWGGNKLREYGKTSKDSVIAESWELSYHPHGQCMIDSGKYKGELLSYIATNDDLGKNIFNHKFFPVLIKLIDANDDLSIQVHPDDEYALKHENSYGKEEMWYVVDADENAKLYVGFARDLEEKELRERIKNNNLIEVMNAISVKKGDCYLIKSGTVHAIGKGCLINEIQENSDLTYRIYDYGRRDANGNLRELHIDKALKVLNLKRMVPENIKSNRLMKNKYFEVEKIENAKEIIADENSFVAFTVLQGDGFVNDIPYKKGDTFFVPANKKAVITGDNLLIATKIA